MRPLLPLALSTLALAACGETTRAPAPAQTASVVPVTAPARPLAPTPAAPAQAAPAGAAGACTSDLVAAVVAGFLVRLGAGSEPALASWLAPDARVSAAGGYLDVMTPGGVEALARTADELPAALSRMARGSDGPYRLEFVDWRPSTDAPGDRALATIQWTRSISMRGARYDLRGDANALVDCGRAGLLFLRGAEGGKVAAEPGWCAPRSARRVALAGALGIVCDGPAVGR